MSVGELCQTCGLCCDGTLFTLVPLSSDDVAPSGVTVDTKPTGARGLRQPCSALSGTCCTVYAQRPMACRRYQCLLFEAMQSEEEQLAGALKIVARAKALAAEVTPSRAEARRAASLPGAAVDPALERAEAWLKFHFVGHRRF